MKIEEHDGTRWFIEEHDGTRQSLCIDKDPGDAGGDPAVTGYPDSLWSLVSNLALSKLD